MLTISLVLLLATAAHAENDNTASPATKNLRHQITSRLDSEFLNTVTRNTTIQDAVTLACDGFPCSYSKQNCSARYNCPNSYCEHAGPPAKVGDKGICRSLGPAPGPAPPVARCGEHGVAGCYGSCKNGAADCKTGNDGECQCVLPPPPADSWKCVSTPTGGQCQNVIGGIDKGSCLAACMPSNRSYSCIDSQCQVVKQGGVAKSVCEAVCVKGANTTVASPNSEICRRLGPGVAGCYGSCKNGATDCKPGNDGECQCVLPPVASPFMNT